MNWTRGPRGSRVLLNLKLRSLTTLSNTLTFRYIQISSAKTYLIDTQKVMGTSTPGIVYGLYISGLSVFEIWIRKRLSASAHRRQDRTIPFVQRHKWQRFRRPRRVFRYRGDIYPDRIKDN